MADRSDILERLWAVIEARAEARPEGSYVVKLLDGAPESIAAKILEEAAEVVDAGRGDDPGHLAAEVADLVFHTWVMMRARGVTPEDVYAVLEARFGVGGLEEKALRRHASAGSDDDAQ